MPITRKLPLPRVQLVVNYQVTSKQGNFAAAKVLIIPPAKKLLDTEISIA